MKHKAGEKGVRFAALFVKTRHGGCVTVIFGRIAFLSVSQAAALAVTLASLPHSY